VLRQEQAIGQRAVNEIGSQYLLILSSIWVEADLHMAGYEDNQRVVMQQRMLDAVAAIPGVTAVGYADRLPLSVSGNDSSVLKSFKSFKSLCVRRDWYF
jgi:hypothetical protein